VLVYSLRVVELPTEYLLAETGQRPVYGYHLSCDFTGHRSALALHQSSGRRHPGRSGLRRPPDHAQLPDRSTRADREEVQIEALYEPDNPLSWLFPLRLAAPLWVEILLRGTSPRACAGHHLPGPGAVDLGPGPQGQVVRCASAMDALRSGLPGMLIQPRCNYRLFEPAPAGSAGGLRGRT
jgi:hypothetical protein